ncbi:HipA domain-containing protein [Rhodococcoides trifolii]|uniref:HipA domain-containing protein n=1 Tax=Rhodococcoides trifolii TaxID=908250 RepID=UPI001E52EB13|nr:HipA domain-containing protein [Rhodococcus trifolii]
MALPEDAGRDGQSSWWLFKPIKRASYRRCDDSSEKIASELAGLIGLPAARVELASRGHESGIISRNVTPDGCSLESGDTLLSEFGDYLSCAGDDRPKNRVGHNLDNIERLLDGVHAFGALASTTSGFGLFAGYLAFDAWIANTDRHAINWGVLTENDDGARSLAPSFDHGSALASGAQEEFVATRDATEYAERGMAHRFENGQNVPLVKLAKNAVARAGASGNQWIERIGELDPDAVQSVVHAVPGMSEVRRTFVSTLLNTNQRRLTA